ncbi:DODA-type extradiol aromatic ring-opening family dioxygenase [Xylophilus ampelinus]|uniref:Aromatic ring-opening dioxygenase catalytic subunit (LigB family) n=1 Tax=Xylophilus ampelinus TaxID=54067 RepID=A0A318SLD9_9BURK|nr:class III extradiol ring-cleavage dioxygenase [Xylophilus ampelinus]MCS4510641.1 dioxygenase [Xylophilus ampelinus]PYE76332.1 aromatic ring-opening dioxygenase catalytic subunit (LigB family) [Xylophilus ampelinus]
MTHSAPDSRLPTYFISHGGGPWPWMLDRMGGTYDLLAASLQDMPRQLGRTPAAVLVVSGHWETDAAYAVMASARPPMLYDYGGFPPHTYEVQYPAPGAPALAEQVRDLVAAAGLPVGLDHRRGFDHGTFSPLAVAFPAADVPVLQLSIRSHYDPAEHLALGRALAPLRDQNVLIVGSGLSYHNLRHFGPQARDVSRAFDDWLERTLVQTDPAARSAHLLHWDAAPAARIAHPQEDHLVPLMVALGAAEQEPAVRVYHEDAFMGGLSVSSFRFGAAPGDAGAATATAPALAAA